MISKCINTCTELRTAQFLPDCRGVNSSTVWKELISLVVNALIYCFYCILPYRNRAMSRDVARRNTVQLTANLI